MRLGQRTRRVGADVVQVEIGGVVVVEGAELRERLDGVVEEEAHRADGVVGPVVVGDRQDGAVGDELGPGGLDPVGHGRVVGVRHPVAAGHQFTDDFEARQYMADGGDADHGDVGTAT